MDASTGLPTSFYIGADGFTEGRTVEPTSRDPVKGSAKEIGSLTNRLMGVEVVCGPVQGTLLYFTDDFTKGGSNLMVEVIRAAISDLRELLALRGLTLPDKSYFSFDNCGENKNRTVFAYLSLLVEMRIIRTAEVYFLIVGHTHTPLDQYFSVLGRKISSIKWVGSRMAMEHLLSHAHTNVSERPLRCRRIRVLYDVKEKWAPFISPIKYHQTPHCFKFSFLESIGKCIMQYKLFCENEWLPLIPIAHITSSLTMEELQMPKCPLVGGWSSFVDSVNTGDELVACNELFTKFCESEAEAQRNFMSDNELEREDLNSESGFDFNRDKPQEGVIPVLLSSAEDLKGLPCVIDPRDIIPDIIQKVTKVGLQVVGAIGSRLQHAPADTFVYTSEMLTTAERDHWKTMASVGGVEAMIEDSISSAPRWTPLYLMSETACGVLSDPATKLRMLQSQKESKQKEEDCLKICQSVSTCIYEIPLTNEL